MLALLLLPAALAAVVPPPLDSRAAMVVSPNKTCGLVIGGNNQGWTCPGDAACCSQFGYCGSTDEFCLTTAGCQSRYSNATNACQAPRSGVSVSPDGTCGSTGVGKNGYRCPPTGATCCSASGYCGNSTDHCDVNLGCQAGFGKCTGTRTPRSFVDLAMQVVGRQI